MKQKIENAELEIVAGGIAYYPDEPGATTGRCGLDADHLNYRYDNYDEYESCICNHYKDKVWTSIEERENYLLECLINEKKIYPIQ